MNTVKALLLCLVASGALSHSSVWAHAGLTTAIPAKDAQLASAPNDITLRFNEKLEAGFSTIKVVDAAGHDVEAKKAMLDSSDPAVLHVQLPALKSGTYTVEWVAVGQDGHRRTGNYKFAVK